MIAIFYNPKKDLYYAKYLRSAYWCSEYQVGYVNQYNHELVCMFYIHNGKLIPCNSIYDYIQKTNISIKEKLIRKIIKFLERSVKNE